MIAFKFKDTTDGHYAVVIARDQQAAEWKLENYTSLRFVLVDQKDVDDLEPFVMVNRILPF